MKARDLMTSDPFIVTPDDSIIRAAKLMRNTDVGCLPVVHDAKGKVLIGLITDRDIIVRCVAMNHHAPCSVRAHMTALPLQTVTPDDDVETVVTRMEQARVRRIPVINSDNKVVGMIAQADIARKLGPVEPDLIEDVLEHISAPGAAQR